MYCLDHSFVVRLKLLHKAISIFLVSSIFKKVMLVYIESLLLTITC